jgi:WD40 repeat protein
MALSIAKKEELAIEPYFLEQPPKRIFYQVGGDYLEKLPVISEIFRRILTPLYGSQDKAIKQIRESKDRKAFLLYEGESPVGVLVFKTVLSSEFSEFGIKDSIEIKSLFVDQSVHNSGKGLGSALIDKLKEEVAKLNVPHKGIHVTVSETKEESLLFFKKKGFQIVHAWKERYKKGVTEYLLSCPARIREMEERKEAPIQNRGVVPSKEIKLIVPEFCPELVHIIHDAHFDDIHGLKRLSDGSFVSGSKDNCLYKWNRNGQVVRIVDEVEPTHRADRNWVTAIEVLDDDYWMSGERNGNIILWKTNGDYVREIKLRLPRFGEHVSHELNVRRVNCLAKGFNPLKPSFFVGFPTMFDEFNFIEGRTIASTKVHQNDWVYGICPLNEKNILMIIGGKVDLWEKKEQGWSPSVNLLPEGARYRYQIGPKKWQRPFISSLVPLRSGKNLFGLSCFDSSVKVLDITSRSIVNEWREHSGKVWFVENITEQLFASGGEDCSIKIWDLREKKSVHTISDQVGEVTAMLSLDDRTFIAGACPKNVIQSNHGAEIRFYDLRK